MLFFARKKAITATTTKIMKAEALFSQLLFSLFVVALSFL
jgi:hypothetical protein